ncbi:MAG: hypothetical protein HYT28_03760, partial [Parcubacteria group bacterium]|nr:hypothetical protein [Parcubacteria group bacterium]
MSENDTTIIIDGKKYISSKKAVRLTGYTNDYIGQLCRAGKVPGKVFKHRRFVEEESLLTHAKNIGGVEIKPEQHSLLSQVKNIFQKIKPDIKTIPKKSASISIQNTQQKITPSEVDSYLPTLEIKSLNEKDTLTNAWGSITYAEEPMEEPTETTETESAPSVPAIHTKPHGMRVPSPSRFFPSGFSHALLSKIVSSVAVVSLAVGGYAFADTPVARTLFAQAKKTAADAMTHLSETGSNLSASALAIAENLRPSFSGTLSYQAPFANADLEVEPPSNLGTADNLGVKLPSGHRNEEKVFPNFTNALSSVSDGSRQILAELFINIPVRYKTL